MHSFATGTIWLASVSVGVVLYLLLSFGLFLSKVTSVEYEQQPYLRSMERQPSTN